MDETLDGEDRNLRYFVMRVSYPDGHSSMFVVRALDYLTARTKLDQRQGGPGVTISYLSEIVFEDDVAFRGTKPEPGQPWTLTFSLD